MASIVSSQSSIYSFSFLDTQHPLHKCKKANHATKTGYHAHLTLTYPAPTLLQSTTNAYLTAFAALESSHLKHRRTVATVPDADGFVTVTRGGRAGPARVDAAERQKQQLDERRKSIAKDDFYRFQNREKRKEREGELRRRFDEDTRRVEGLRARRGGLRPEV